MNLPDYDRLREQTPFGWRLVSTYLALLDLTGIAIRDLFLLPEAGIELYRRGRPRLREVYGDLPVVLPGVCTAPVSYGHVNTLGAELVFPEGGEVNLETLCPTLEDGLRVVRQERDFSRCGMFPFYLDYHRQMVKAFPGEPVGFAFKAEGPLTTAYALRRDGFFYDFYDQPEKTEEFLGRLVDSAVEYGRCVRQVVRNDFSAALPAAGSVADDLAAMLNPGLWGRFVVPFHERWFKAVCTGRRSCHIENLTARHLPYLEQLGVVGFDPSVSPNLTPAQIASHCRVPFSWHLFNFHVMVMTEAQVRQWVLAAVGAGASQVVCHVCHGMGTPAMVGKVAAFADACREVDTMFAANATRNDIARLAPGG